MSCNCCRRGRLVAQALCLVLAVGVCVGVGISAGGCGDSHAAILYGPQSTLHPSDYPMVLGTWTRSAKIYQGLDDKLFITATFHSPEFRRAFAVAFPDIYGHGGDVTRRELVDLTGVVEQFHTFFVSAYTPNRRWNDFDQADSIWRLTLIGHNNDVSVEAKDVVPIRIDANLRAVYPYLGHFDKAYLVRFPLADPMNRLVIPNDSKGFTLRVASALGVAEMTWKLSPPPTTVARATASHGAP